jgi:hypothetical protein
VKWIHRIMVNCRGKDGFLKGLEDIGFGYRRNDSSIGSFAEFEISHADPTWETISDLMQRYGIPDYGSVIEYSPIELVEPDFLKMWFDWPNGYPLPDDNAGYEKTTYDDTQGCDQCGMGYVQKEPFRIKGEPKWGRRCYMKLNWVNDEYFVRPEIWHEVFKPFGIRSRPVLKYKGDTALETVVQLDISDFATSSLKNNSMLIERCSVCGRERYRYVDINYYPYPTFEVPQSFPLFKTKEYFGSGGESIRYIVISQDLYRYMLKRKQVRGVHFIPLVDDPQEYIRTHLE